VTGVADRELTVSDPANPRGGEHAIAQFGIFGASCAGQAARSTPASPLLSKFAIRQGGRAFSPSTTRSTPNTAVSGAERRGFATHPSS
jgi:hypothetical protein